MLAHLIALEAEQAVRGVPVPRDPTPGEAAILSPDLSRLDDAAGGDVVRAELGYGTREALIRYVRT